VIGVEAVAFTVGSGALAGDWKVLVAGVLALAFEVLGANYKSKENM